ncbi:SURF1 family protein [Alcaligenaceae bacterium]|nr:SURF1 family protein [Alcaligenaceae bacterium]
MARPHTTYYTVAALILLGAMAVVFTLLGNWQLDRAKQRIAIKQAIEAGRNTAALNLEPHTPRQDLVPWRPATAHGVWLHKLTVLLENRNYQNQPGYWVATPLLIDADSNTAVLVLRGWLPRPLRPNEALPAIPAPTNELSVQGELLEHVPRLFELWSWSGNNATQLPSQLPDAARPLPQVQNLNLAAYAKASGLTLLPTVLAQISSGTTTTTNRTQLLQEWPEPSLDSDKNHGYALQWFGFAAIAAGAWLLTAWRALRRKLKSQSQ